MYTNKTLYYLEQLKIRPWVKRHEPCLYVRSDKPLGQKETKLLEQLSLFIGAKQYRILDEEMKHWQPQQPVLLLSCQSDLEERSWKVEVLPCAPLSELVQHPTHKKQLYQSLAPFYKYLARK